MATETFNFQIMSDLHLETHPSYDYDIPQTAPYLALLGDIGHVEKDAFLDFLERQVRRYRIVFYLFGNHEPYHLSMDFAKKRVATFERKLKKSRNNSTGEFVFLDRTRYDISDRLTVLGCTLFTRVLAEQARAVQSRVVDFKDILHWDVGDHVDAHLEDLAWLNAQVDEIARAEPQRKIVIFTHHSPCTDDRAVNPRFKESEVSSGFATDLRAEKCWKSGAVVLWGFGHTHYNCDFVDDVGKRIVANQKGYYLFPQSTFGANKIVEVTIDRSVNQNDADQK